MAREEMIALACVVGMVDWASAMPTLINGLPLILTRMEEMKHTTPTRPTDRGSFQPMPDAGAKRRISPLDSDRPG